MVSSARSFFSLFLCLAWSTFSHGAAPVVEVPTALKEVMATIDILQGNGSLSSALHWRDCRPHLVLRPLHTEHVADLVMALHRSTLATGQRYSLRASRQGFHSTNNFSCAAASETTAAAAASVALQESLTEEHGAADIQAAQPGQAAAASIDVYHVMLDTSAMSKVLHFDADAPSVTVQAGMTFEELEDYLFERRLALPSVYVTPVLSGMTLGAALVTGAHGSALEGHGTLAPYVSIAVMVDGTGEARVVQWPGELLEGSLGLLGVVTEMTLLLAPARKVMVKQLQAEDIDMVADIREIVDNSRALSLDVMWSPAAGMYTARVWHGLDDDEEGQLATNTFMQAPQAWLDKMDKRLHRDQQDPTDRGAVMCELLGDLSTFPHFTQTGQEATFKNWGSNLPHDAHMGWQHQMASPRCPAGEQCLWRRLKWTSHELGISGEDLGAWVEDARRVMSHARSCPGFIFNLRFVPSTNSPLAMHSGRQTVAIDISTFGSTSSAGLHIKQQALFDELVQMTLCRYEGRPHWASGTNRLFTGPCPVRDMFGPGFEEFLQSRPRFDPSDLFLPPLFARVIDRRGGDLYPGCAVENECFCQEDVHCGPHHVCQPAAVFPEFNVCRPEVAARSSGSEL